MCFLYLWWWYMRFLIYSMSDVNYRDFKKCKPIIYFWGKCPRSWCVIIFYLLLDYTILIFLASMCMRDIWLWFSFLEIFLSSFGIRVLLATENRLKNIPSCSVFCKSLYRIDITDFLHILENSPGKPSGHEVFLMGRF